MASSRSGESTREVHGVNENLESRGAHAGYDGRVWCAGIAVWTVVAACGRVDFDPLATSDGEMTACPGPLATTFDGALPSGWMPYGNAMSTTRVTNGALQLEIDGSIEGDSGLVATTSFAGRSIAIEVASIIDSAGPGVTVLSIKSLVTQNVLHVYTQSQTLLLERLTPPSTWEFFGNSPHDPIAQRWWRLRESAGELSASVSPDGSTWTVFGEVPAFDVSSVEIKIWAGAPDVVIPSDVATIATVLDCN